MIIEERTLYIFDQVEFTSVANIRQYIEDELGQFIDSAFMNRLGPKDRIAMLDAIISQHERISGLLSAEYEHENIDGELIKSNVLDLPIHSRRRS